ncbi:MAG TPA: YwiC-like family protein [Kofleriaceae bacterium]|nr:YwiC-like family protein [Kofleriaceae bacterium]
MRSAHLSLPAEHGAWITTLGAAALAIYLAPAPLAAATAALACIAGFVGRGPIERGAAGRTLGTGDRLLLAGCAAAAAAAVLLLPAGPARLLAAATAIGFPAAGAAARALRAQRTLAVELAGLAATGGVAAVVLLAGGAGGARIAVVAAAIAVYAAATVLAVRGEARRGPPAASRRNALLGLTVGAAGALALLTAVPLAAAGFLPRLIAAGARALRPARRNRIGAIALRETLALLAFLVLLAAGVGR